MGTEAIFLSRRGAAALPATFVVASLVTVAASLVYAAVVGRLLRERASTRPHERPWLEAAA